MFFFGTNSKSSQLQVGTGAKMTVKVVECTLNINWGGGGAHYFTNKEAANILIHVIL